MSTSTTLTLRLDAATRKRLEALARSTKRSKSFLAGEAIAAYLEAQEWQLGEVRAGLSELASGKKVSGEEVTAWLKTWGKTGEKSPPRCK
jgi:RHH-type rel operon transcriptional repressor/antitoxin RelB